MLGKVVGRHESKDVGFQDFQVRVMERFDGRLLDGSVHPLGLTVGPRMLWLGELMLDAVLIADTVEDLGTEIAPARPVAVFR